jgi:2-methylcitrate dehydratase PrpD
MAHNTVVAADADAPPVTRILAEFVASHPSQGWDASVEREAHRTLLNWTGCAIGASRHATADAALAAVRELAPSPQATILGRPERVDVASAAR